MRRAATLLIVAALGAGAAVVAQASIPGQGGRIDGCYSNRSGSLRVIDPSRGGKCVPTETALSWNQSGPAGAPGQPGPPGPPGRTPTTYSVVKQATAQPGQTVWPLAQCDVGDAVIGGGFYDQPVGASAVVASYPQTPSGAWQVTARNDGPVASVDVYAVALCQH